MGKAGSPAPATTETSHFSTGLKVGMLFPEQKMTPLSSRIQPTTSAFLVITDFYRMFNPETSLPARASSPLTPIMFTGPSGLTFGSLTSFSSSSLKARTRVSAQCHWLSPSPDMNRSASYCSMIFSSSSITHLPMSFSDSRPLKGRDQDTTAPFFDYVQGYIQL